MHGVCCQHNSSSHTSKRGRTQPWHKLPAAHSLLLKQHTRSTPSLSKPSKSPIKPYTISSKSSPDGDIRRGWRRWIARSRTSFQEPEVAGAALGGENQDPASNKDSNIKSPDQPTTTTITQLLW